MTHIDSFASSLALLAVCSTALAAGSDVTFQTRVYNPAMPFSTTGNPVCIQGDGLLVSGCDGPGAGAFSKTISAITCRQADNATGSSISIVQCLLSGIERTEGTNNTPCSLHGDANRLRTTYLCDVDLPAGTLIEKVTAFGSDISAIGYFEAAIWRVQSSNAAITYISPSYGGVWQSSGLADAPGNVNFPIYSDLDAPHVMLEGNHYLIGFALKESLTRARNFLIDYTIVP